MSRSRKKVPAWDNWRWAWWFKRKASKRARRVDLDSGGYYKKVYPSYEINDFRGLFRHDNHEYRYKDWMK